MMAMAALAIAGCSQNEVTDVNPDIHPAVGFDVYTGVQTKGAETTTSTLKSGDGFGILAYQTGDVWNNDKSTATPSFMYNEHATWTAGSPAGSWDYENSPKFWPTNGNKITFFAYAPYESSPADGANKKITLSGQSDTGAPTITFEVNTGNDWKDMVDLVTDGRTDIQDQTSASNSGTVTFKFKHVLTKIKNIMVKPDTNLGSNTKIYVTGLELDPGTNVLYSKAIYQFDNDEWVATTTPGASYFSGVKDLSAFLNKKTQNQWGYTTSSVDASNHSTATALFPDNQALYFIPVNNTTGTATEGDLKLKISYDIVSTTDGSTNHTSTLTNKEINLPANTFKKGTAHTYTLTIKMNAININVEETIEGWTDSSNEAVDVK